MTIRFLGKMGTDLSVVNAARSSFAKESFTLSEGDRRLLHFLAQHGHHSPYRHAVIRLLIKSDLATRLMWETGKNRNNVGAYRAGQVFIPTLTDMAALFKNAPAPMHSGFEWRWTASLQAAARFVLEWAGDPIMGGWCDLVAQAVARHFPGSMSALLPMDPPTETDTEPMVKAGPRVPVLDKGYVRLVDHLHGDVPAEAVLSFEIKAPLVVRSQWFKYVGGGDHSQIESGNGDDCSWGDPLYARNEQSRRYVEGFEFYQPTVWRSAPANKKQGSGGPLLDRDSKHLAHRQQFGIEESLAHYGDAVDKGAAIEQARIFLPAYGLYTTWRWTASFPAVRFFLMQRLGHDAQAEINAYAQAINGELEGLGWA